MLWKAICSLLVYPTGLDRKHQLTDRQQEIIQLYFYKGLNQYEIAEELGIVRPVVSKIMAAAIKRLKKSF